MDTSPEDIGTLLKERREQLGYSLSDAAQKTRIRKTYLESIEENRFSDLPGQAYVTGFVGVYARYLGLNSKAVLAGLADSPASDIKPAASVIVSKPQATGLKSKPAVGGWGAFAGAFLLVLLLGGALCVWPSFMADDEPLEVIEESRPDVVAPPEPVVEQDEVVTPPVNSATVEHIEPVIVVDKIVDQPASREPLPVIASSGSSLRMLALAESSLIIKVDDREPHEYRLHDGLDLTWRIKSKVDVELAAEGSARFWLDGQELDIAGLKSFLLQPSAEE